MADMMKVKDAATLWGLTPRRVSELCKQGKIARARKMGKAWMIPVGTPKPTDQRIRSGAYAKVALQENLPLPIGISDYRLASTEYYYIDKTMLIKDFLDERPMVSLFTRPRRFGKTLNMDMLRTFFEKSDEDTSIYFRNKNHRIFALIIPVFLTARPNLFVFEIDGSIFTAFLKKGAEHIHIERFPETAGTGEQRDHRAFIKKILDKHSFVDVIIFRRSQTVVRDADG